MSLLHNVQEKHSYEGGEGGPRTYLKFPLLLKCCSIFNAKVLKGTEVIFSNHADHACSVGAALTQNWQNVRNTKCEVLQKYANTQLAGGQSFDWWESEAAATAAGLVWLFPSATAGRRWLALNPTNTVHIIIILIISQHSHNVLTLIKADTVFTLGVILKL